MNSNIDKTDEVDEKELEKALDKNLLLSNDLKDIQDSNIYIITVPTPITKSKKPDLSYLKEASKMVGKSLSKGDIVVYESTVYPGCTEEECVPVLESVSGLNLM